MGIAYFFNWTFFNANEWKSEANYLNHIHSSYKTGSDYSFYLAAQNCQKNGYSIDLLEVEMNQTLSLQPTT